MDNNSLERELLAATGGGSGGPPPRQLIVKLLKPVKSRTSTVAMVRYVARLHADDAGPPVAVHNEAGEEVLDPVMPRRERLLRLDAELGFWPLQADADNLSAHATALLEAQGAAAVGKLAERDRFRNRQGYHLVVSLESEEEPEDVERLLSAVQEAVIDLFGETGHSALLALHRDTEHPHVHVLVSARSSLPPFRRLHFGRDDGSLDDLRETFARHARDEDLDVVITRRKDRPDLIPKLLSGEVHLRSKDEMRRGRNYLEQKAPGWFAHHGPAYEDRRLALGNAWIEAERLVDAGLEASPTEAVKSLLPVHSRTVLMIPEAPDLAALFRSRYVEPDRAYDAYRELLAEGAELRADGIRLPNRRLALWALDKHPIAFGDIQAGALRPLSANDRCLLDMPPPRPAGAIGSPQAMTRPPAGTIEETRQKIERLARQRRARGNRQAIGWLGREPSGRPVEASRGSARSRPDAMRPSRG